MKHLLATTIIVFAVNWHALHANDLPVVVPNIQGNTISINKVAVDSENFFSVKLISDKSFKINKAVTNCACLEIMQSPETLVKGAEFEVHFLYKPNKPGDYNIKVEFEGNENQKTVFYFKATAEGISKQKTEKSEFAISLLKRKTKNIRKNLYVSAASTVKNRKQITLIDIRRGKSAVGIPGALNVSPAELKTLDFLKSKNLVIFDSGNYNDHIEETCLQLRKYGFKKTFILHHGVMGFHRAGGVVEGNINKISELTSLQFLQSKSFVNSSFILLEEGPELSGFTSDLDKIELKADSQIFLIGKASQIPEKLKSRNVFTLSGGLTEFKEFLVKQSKILSPKEAHSSKRVGNCGGCPKDQPQKIIFKGK